MIQNRVYTLINKFEAPSGLSFPAGQEFEIVQGVVYVNGFMLEPNLQNPTMVWIDRNPHLFKDTTKNW